MEVRETLRGALKGEETQSSGVKTLNRMSIPEQVRVAWGMGGQGMWEGRNNSRNSPKQLWVTVFVVWGSTEVPEIQNFTGYFQCFWLPSRT